MGSAVHLICCTTNRALSRLAGVGSDTTYRPLASGAWAYLCAFQGGCIKHVVGWQVRADMTEAMVASALQRALLAQRLAPVFVVHSDRGGQCVGNAYKALLRDARARRSHSRHGECYDNVLPGTTQAESLVTPQNQGT